MSFNLYLRIAACIVAGTLPAGSQSASVATWSAAGAATNLTLSAGFGASTTTLQTGTTAASTSAQNGFLGMFLSEPFLGSGTIGGGAMTFALAEQESSLSANFWLNGVEIYVWRPSTGLKVGTVKAFGSTSLGGLEPTAINQTQATFITGVTSSAVNYVQGDILVIEPWSRFTQATAKNFTGSLAFDGPTAITSENQLADATRITFAEDPNFSGVLAPTDSFGVAAGGPFTLSNGNKTYKNVSGSGVLSWSSRSATWRASGKYYFEGKLDTRSSNGTGFDAFGVAGANLPVSGQRQCGFSSDSWGFFSDGSVQNNNAVLVSTGKTYTTGAVVRIAIDFAAGKGWVGDSLGWYNSGDPAAGTNATFTFTASTRLWACACLSIAAQETINLGSDAFSYSIPLGFLSWDGTQSGVTSATVAVTDGADVAALATSVTTGAAAAITDAPDVAAAVGRVTTGASIAATDGADLAALSAQVTTGGAVGATDAPDVAAVAAVNWMTGQIGATEGADVAAASARVTTAAAVAATEGADVAAVVAANWTNAQIAVTDGADTAAASASVTTGASISTTDAPDVAALIAAIWMNAQVAGVDGADALDAETSVTTGAALTLTDAPDVASLIVAIWMTGQAAVADAADVVDVGATLIAITTADVSAVDAPDIADIVTSVTTGAAIAVTDAADVGTVLAATWMTAQVDAVDAADVSEVSGGVTTGASIAAIDGADSTVVTAANWTLAAIAARDGSDRVALATSVTTAAAVGVLDAPDVVAAAAAIWTTARLELVDAADSIDVEAAPWMTAQLVLVDGADVVVAVALAHGAVFEPVPLAHRFIVPVLSRAELDPLIAARIHRAVMQRDYLDPYVPQRTSVAAPTSRAWVEPYP